MVGLPVVDATLARAPLKDTHADPLQIFHTPDVLLVSSHTSSVAGVAGAVSDFTPDNLAARPEVRAVVVAYDDRSGVAKPRSSHVAPFQIRAGRAVIG
jgi:hypothetical protein